LEFTYDPENNRLYPKNPQFWANLSRMIGWYFADPKSDYLLFLDCDEILDPSRFLPWLHSGAYREWEAMQLACYWYFFKETWQSVRWDDTPVLVNRSSISVDKLFGLLERGEFYTQCLGSKARNVMGLDGLPMIHHYSWVRNKEQMMRKVCSWTHRNERDWAELVEKEFIAPFRGKDFVHGSALQEVQAFATFDLDQKPVPNLKRNSAPKNVRIVNTDEIHKIDLQLRFNLYVN
jgi:hypothetical protein